MTTVTERPVALPETLPADAEVLAFVRREDTSLSQMIEKALEVYADRPALAWRPVEGGRLSAHYTTMSYAELGDRGRAVANWLHASAEGGPAMKPGEIVATLAFGSKDFVVSDLALGLSGYPVAPLQTTASAEQLEALFDRLGSRCLFTSAENLPKAVPVALGCAALTHMVVIDIDEGDADQAGCIDRARDELSARAGGACALITLADVIARGRRLPPAPTFVPDPAADSPLSIIYFTSGSTGTPKGAMYSERLVKPNWAMAREGFPVVVTHYQPLNHSFGKSYVSMAMASGGTTYFTAKSDLSTLLDDIRTSRPTCFAVVPRVAELFYQRFHADKREGESSEAAFDRFREDVLGGRLQDAVTGSAPLSPELAEFVETLLQKPLMDSYGTTEVGLVSTNGKVLCPPVIDYKLIDVPELGYFATDKPFPRGELAVKTTRLFMGYHGLPELTASVIDADGYYYTGDVMEEIAPGTIRYLDRRNNVIKLAQGEFVPVAALESLYAGGDPAIQQVYLHGNSSRAYLVGVVVPNRKVLPADMPEAEVKRRILDTMARIAAENKRHSYEVPRDILIENEPFSQENGLLAGVGKVLRPAFRAKYDAPLEALYARLTSDADAELDALRRDGRDAPTLATVCRAAQAILGREVTQDEPVSFGELGGDSLSALSFALLLEDIYGFPVEVGTVMHPAATLGTVAVDIDARKSGDRRARDAQAVHGDDLAVLQASDLTLDKLVDPAVLEAASDLPPIGDGAPKRVLLTGGNGFLGRFLMLEWLRRMERDGGELVCLVRGADDAQARERLLAAFDGGDGALRAEIDRLADGRLTVLAADLSAERLGLSDAQWDDLAATVDVIVNPAALVNHKLPYRQLFAANTAGTAELIALALTAKRKRIVHISTIAASSNDGRRADEDADIRAAIPSWTTSEAYADGYGASKWAAEVLLAEAADRYGVPVSIHRSNMILAPTEFSGQLNVPDMFTRLMLSLGLTGIAPASFYSGDAASAHYEGLPVDFLARAIVALGEDNREGLHTFHTMNPNDDGISQDTFVDWIADTGVPMRRVEDYADWNERFTTAMRALPEAQRNASLLPLMDAFAQPSPARPGRREDAPRFVEGVCRAGLDRDGAVPGLTRAVIERYVADLRALGLMPA